MMSLATDILLCFSFCLFLFSFGYKSLRDESSFRAEPLRTSPHEPFRVDLPFYYDFKKIYTNILLELPKDDQVLLLQGSMMLS